MTLIQFAIGSWFVFVIASAFAHQYFKRRVNAAASVNISAAFATQNEHAMETLKAIAALDKKFDISAQNARLLQPKEATRVYASLVQRGFETRILVQPANSFEEMQAIVIRELGTDWVILITAFTDVLGWKQHTPSEPKAAHVERPIATFIHELEYSRDHLADSPTEKAAVESIISRLKSQHYGNSRSGSAA